MILYKQFNFGLASQTFGLVTSSNSLPEGQPHLFIFVSPCGVGIFHAKNRLEYFPFLCFAVKEKFFDTIWRPHFPSGDPENISVASWHLPNKSYFGLCTLRSLKYRVVEMEFSSNR